MKVDIGARPRVGYMAPYRHRLPRRGVGAWRAVPLLLLAGSMARGETAPMRVVPADDAALASMVLLAVGRTAPVLLFDPWDAAAVQREVAKAGRPVECLVRASTSPATRTLLESSAGVSCTRVDDLVALARQLWPRTRTVVMAPANTYESLLRGAALAAAADAALLPVSGDTPPTAIALTQSPLETLYVLPGVKPPSAAGARVTVLESADAVAREALRHLGQPRMVVVANPRDRQGLFSPTSLSLLAPLIAAAHRAPLVLVGSAAAEAVETDVQHFIADQHISPTYIYLVGDELALRSHRVPDPVLRAGGPEALGGGREVRVELFSELQHGRPQDYVVGRLVAEDAALGSATLARQLHTGLGTGERVVMLSNADDAFALGETISRTTASELRNAGVTVRARYGSAVTPAEVQMALEQASTLVWEGHARDLTLEERGGTSAQRTPPLVVLQGCYTLDRSDPFIFFEHGTQAIVATSAAIYSASGSAFARALFDGLLYDGVDLGTAVRNARNYLLAVTELKKRRGHTDWTKTYRAALAFTLWGDPTVGPRFPSSTPKLPPATWRLQDGRLDLSIPKRRLATASVGRYVADPVPRGMLAGLILRDGDRRERVLKQLFFEAVEAPPDATAACPPSAEWEVVSFFAPRTRTLSVLARPPGSHNPPGEFQLPLVADSARCP
jgi:Peptidase family C25